MNRTYIAKRLLEHGALSMPEFLEITGWKPRQAYRTMQQLVKTKVAVAFNPPRLRHTTRHYALASSITTDGLQPSTGNWPLRDTDAVRTTCHG